MIRQIIPNILLIILFAQACMPAQGKKIVAYYPEWGAAHHTYYVKNIKTSGSADKINFLIYAFVEPGPDLTGKIVPKFMNSYIDYAQPYSAEMSVDGIADDSTQQLKGQFNQLKKLKKMYPGLKVLLSIGGWTGSVYYSDAALTDSSREAFVNDCIDKFIYGNLPIDSSAGGKGVAAGVFDGFDLDWEFPVANGIDGIHHDKNDKENFSKLIELFREKLNKINPNLYLTAAVPADKPNIDGYDIKNDQKYLSWYNLMTYDFHGSWDTVTAHHTNLFSSTGNAMDSSSVRSFDRSVRYMMDTLGVGGSKIIPGAAFYGRGWANVDSANYGLYQKGTPAAGTSESGIDNYCNLITLLNKGYTYHWDSIAMAPWLYSSKDKTFWSLDDPKSIALKVHYAEAYKLGGIMFWDISGDDSAGTLINTIYTGNMPDIKINKNLQKEDAVSISITGPANNSVAYSGSSIIITTSVNRKDKIKKVEFFGDDSTLGYVTIMPFNWVWFNVPEGKHKLKAVATDINGNKIYSNENIIFVKNRN